MESSPARGPSSDTSLGLLEFRKLLGILSGFANSGPSRAEVLGIRPLRGRDHIEKRFGQVRDIMRMTHEGDPLKLSAFPDISPLMLKARPEGAVLDARELAAFTPVLEILAEIAVQVSEKKDLVFLNEITGMLTGFPELLKVLGKSVDGEGNILDTASHALAGLRAQVRKQESRIRKKLNEMAQEEGVAVFLQDTFITTRSGRWVIPVRMDSKGQVPGVVHDVSKSGETAFVEPLAVIGLSNELENLAAEQKAEEIRILRNISAKIRASADELDAQYRVLVSLDALNCIARLADELQLEIPQINESGIIRLVRARHPLLQIAFKKSGGGQEVVPLDLELGGENTVMVITGSNAGGKTVAIKTIGLLLAMALSGMPVPADSSSSFPVVHGLLADIGDEQSIEENLSTFSAHVANISAILRNADAGTLVMIDELGTGTDPDEGAALACAVLKELRSSGALTFATTHLTDIKGFVHRTEGMLNASMEFDRETFTPLYRLRPGEPGQSHALEAARRYGLPDSVIETAKGLLGGIKLEFDNLIADLNQKRADYERALEELQKEREEIGEKAGRLEQMMSETEARQREALASAYRQASDIISDMKRQLSALLEEAKKADRASRREVMKRVEAKQEQVREKIMEYTPSAAPPIDELGTGDIVFVRTLGYDAAVVDVNRKQNRLRVRAGGMEIEVPVGDIEFRKGRTAEVRETAPRAGGNEEAVPPKINLVGMRVDDALSLLEPFLNRASLAGLPEVTVIHGVGAGILLRAVRGHLDGHPLVKGFRSGAPREGGNGVTVVTMA